MLNSIIIDDNLTTKNEFLYFTEEAEPTSKLIELAARKIIALLLIC